MTNEALEALKAKFLGKYLLTLRLIKNYEESGKNETRESFLEKHFTQAQINAIEEATTSGMLLAGKEFHPQEGITIPSGYAEVLTQTMTTPVNQLNMLISNNIETGEDAGLFTCIHILKICLEDTIHNAKQLFDETTPSEIKKIIEKYEHDLLPATNELHEALEETLEEKAKAILKREDIQEENLRGNMDKLARLPDNFKEPGFDMPEPSSP